MQNLKIPLNFGTLAGIILFIIFLVYYFLDFSPLGNITWATFWVPFIFVFVGVKRYRDTELEGFISYGKAYLISLVIALVYATLFGMFVYLFGTFIDGAIIDMYINEALLGLERAQGFMGEEMLEKAVEEIEKTTVGSLAFSDAFNKIIGAALINLILAAFLKKSPEIFPETIDEQS
ncbi:MAG: hypothetical protein COA57_10300 [Flavobacteriales bacterium]|nr:MAG: hypothetical protein COA57_10300 [Flavobacteriales bacterium]